MLLAIDVGNTNTVVGVYEGKTLKANWRLETTARRTYDEWGIAVAQLCAHDGLDRKQPAPHRALGVCGVTRDVPA